MQGPAVGAEEDLELRRKEMKDRRDCVLKVGQGAREETERK